MTSESGISPEYDRIDELIRTSPDDAWNALREFLRTNPPRLEALSLTDFFLGLHLDKVIDVIEREVDADEHLAHAIADSTAWEGSGPATHRLIALQRRLWERFGYGMFLDEGEPTAL